MNDLPRQKLREIVARYGPSLSDDPRRTEALLRDFCGEYKREIFVLVSALREQVVADLLAARHTMPPEVLLAQLTQRLQDNLALTEGAARWAVESWALALGVIQHPLPGPLPPGEGERVHADAPVSPGWAQPADRPSIARPAAPQATTGERLLLHTLRGHTGWVYSVAFHPDGRLLASGSQDQTVRLWDVASGRAVALRGRNQVFSQEPGFWSAPVYSVAFSPDGRTLTAGGGDGRVRLWDVASGQEVRRPLRCASAVYSLAFGPGGHILASASSDTIVLWDVARGREERQLKGHAHVVQGVAFSPDGRTLASASGDGTVRLWEVASGREVQRLRGHTKPVWSVAFSPDGRILASGSYDRTVRLWTVPQSPGQRSESGEGTRLLGEHARGVNSVAFSPDGRVLAAASWDAVVLWDVAGGREVMRLRGHTHSVQSVAFSPDGHILASGSWDHTVRLWRVEELLI